MPIKVIVNGANGKMGQISCQAVLNSPLFDLVAKTDAHDDLTQIISEKKAEVVIDFTTPKTVYQNTIAILDAGARPVVGTTGLSSEQLADLSHRCEKLQRGAIIAPNFSIGALLMIQFAGQAARYFEQVEIIEMHHEKKLDAPSGTAIKTAQVISEQKKETSLQPSSLPAARGDIMANVPIHSVRLPGLVAHQMVLFGGPGETLTLRHDSTHRECFMPGVLLACEKVMALNSLVYGLENLIF